MLQAVLLNRKKLFSTRILTTITNVKCENRSISTLCTRKCYTEMWMNKIITKYPTHREWFSTNSSLLNRAYEVNTNVTKDVIMFKYDNPKFYKILNMFSISQFIFWLYLSHFTFTSMKDAPVEVDDKELPWWRRTNLGENKYKNTLSVLCFVIGYGILATTWVYTMKSVRYLILRKGGNSVTFVTYGPFGKNRMMTVDLKNVSCQETRQNSRVQLPIKVKNTFMHYMLDMRGEFTNGKLFDYTAGLKRNLNSS